MSTATPRGGLLLVDKPPGCTSHDVVQFVRWALAEKAVGHTGTLDPPATGLLVLLVGSATRLAPWLAEDDKRYWARIVLGRSTTTGDAEGETIATADIDDTAAARAAAELSRMLGVLELVPPSVSAIKIAGRPAHARVRAGEHVELPPRSMRVDRVTVLAVDSAAHAIEAELDVGKGTYIRALATELGDRLGVPAHLHRLRRLSVGAMRVDDPRVVAGLHARARPGRPGALVEMPALATLEDTAARRAAIRDALRVRLVSPLSALRGPRATRTAEDPGLRRLLLGQAVAAAELPELADAPAGWVVGPCALVRVELDGIRARPVRVIRDPDADAGQGGGTGTDTA